MDRILDRFSRIVTARPWITILVLVLVTLAMGYGATYRVAPTEGADLAFLPPEHRLVTASGELDESFSESGKVSLVTLIFRGDAMTPAGLAQMDNLVNSIAADEAVRGHLVADDALVTPALVVKGALQVLDPAAAADLGALPQEQIDGINQIPQVAEVMAALTGVDTDGTSVAIGTVRLRDTGDDPLAEAERRINELASASEGPLSASSLSTIVVADEYQNATETGMAPLIGIALLLIAVLLLLFTRTIGDTLLTLLGLIFSLVWVIGVEGWIGPKAIGLIGAPSSLTAMVPVIIISLTVDYGIQTVSHYREQRIAGDNVSDAVRAGLRNVTIPLTLAAVTTIVSLLVSLFSPIGVIGDFGVVAGFGVGMSLIVMLTLIPAGRKIIDRRREAKGKLKEPRPIAQALPGISRAAEFMGRAVTRRPWPYLIVVVAITVGMGFAAADLKSEFSIRDILPRSGDVVEDMDTLEASVGGSTEQAVILLKAEITETRTLLNIQELTEAFDDPERRPAVAAGPIQSSYYAFMQDWITDSGEPGDKYDADLAALFAEASDEVELDQEQMQEFVDTLVAKEPELGRLLVNDPNGIDTMLLQFPSVLNVPIQAREAQSEIEALWQGDDDAITVTSGDIVAVAVTDQITDGQTSAVGATIGIALAILVLFFWITLRQPALGLVAVIPIGLMLVCVLGTMALLDIPYSLVTSIITALSIGIGVDYTIHIIHRYREEFQHTRNPEKAAIRTLSTTGSALLGSALTTAFGFGVLIASPLLSMQQFGITATITIVYSLIVSVTMVLPAMVVWGAFQNMRMRNMVERVWEELDVAIEDIHQRHEEEERKQSS